MNKRVIPKEIDIIIQRYIISLSRRYNLYQIKEDAYNEALLAYYKALDTYNPAKGKEVYKWAKITIWNTLNTYYKKEKENLKVNLNYYKVKETNCYKIDYLYCDIALETLKELTNLEKKIFLLYLEGDSFLAIAKEINYDKIKVINIVSNIQTYLQTKAKDVSVTTI